MWKSFNSVAEKLMHADTMADVYKTIVSEAQLFFNADYGSIHIRTADGFVRAYSTLPEKLKSVKARKKGFTYQAFINMSPFSVSRDKMNAHHPEFEVLGKGASVFTPLIYRGTTIAVLTVNAAKEVIANKQKFSDEDIEMLRLFGCLCAMSIQKVRAQEEMANAVKMRDHFISLAAHELRTPLTSIHGYIQLLQKKIEQDNPTIESWISELQVQTYRLIYLVNELLEITRINTSKQKYFIKRRLLLPLVERVVNRYRHIHRERTIHFISKRMADEYVQYDVEKIEQLLAHLLDNAEKFSNDTIPITVVLWSTSRNVKLQITNRGDHLEVGDIPHIFDRFYKGKNSVLPGMGLGLFLAKNIASRHEGKIRVNSSKDEKTVVTLTLPKA